jgi:hypothetical protein
MAIVFCLLYMGAARILQALLFRCHTGKEGLHGGRGAICQHDLFDKQHGFTRSAPQLILFFVGVNYGQEDLPYEQDLDKTGAASWTLIKSKADSRSWRTKRLKSRVINWKNRSGTLQEKSRKSRKGKNGRKVQMIEAIQILAGFF